MIDKGYRLEFVVTIAVASVVLAATLMLSGLMRNHQTLSLTIGGFAMSYLIMKYINWRMDHGKR